MRSRLARFLLIFTALWLPLQAVEGMTMNLGMPKTQALAQQEEIAADACPLHHHAADSAPAMPQPPDKKACDNCGVCHLAGAAYIPMTEVVATILPASHGFAILPAVERPSHIPEPPQYPPRRA